MIQKYWTRYPMEEILKKKDKISEIIDELASIIDNRESKEQVSKIDKKKSQTSIEDSLEVPKKSKEENLEEEVDDELKEGEHKEIVDDGIDKYMSIFAQKSIYDGNAEFTKLVVSAYNGHMHVSNVKQNYELAATSSDSNLSSMIDNGGFKDMTSEDVLQVATITTINGNQGQWMYRDVTMEMKDRFNNWMYDPVNKIKYMAAMSFIGIGTAQMDAREARPNMQQ